MSTPYRSPDDDWIEMVWATVLYGWLFICGIAWLAHHL
jgi:hypothetical protein